MNQINNIIMAKKTIFEGMSFDDICKKYLKEGAEIDALAGDDMSTEAPVDDFDAEMEAPTDEFDVEEGIEGEGDVTITLSADLVSALRSILALIDGEGVEDAPVDELGAEDDIAPADDAGLEMEPEGDVGEFEEEESDEEEGVFEEDEETLLGNGQGAQAAPVSSPSSAPNRKKETPAVNRKGTGEGDFSKVTSRMGEPATVSSATSAPDRKKGTPAVDRKPTNTVHKAKPGKKVLDINR